MPLPQSRAKSSLTLQSNMGELKNAVVTTKEIISSKRMMIVCIYHMVSEKKTFCSFDYEELMDPQNHKERAVLNEKMFLLTSKALVRTVLS